MPFPGHNVGWSRAGWSLGPLSQAATLVGGELAAHHESSLTLAHSCAWVRAGGFVRTNSANLLDQAL